jgi:hypothetical protein
VAQCNGCTDMRTRAVQFRTTHFCPSWAVKDSSSPSDKNEVCSFQKLHAVQVLVDTEPYESWYEDNWARVGASINTTDYTRHTEMPLRACSQITTGPIQARSSVVRTPGLYPVCRQFKSVRAYSLSCGVGMGIPLQREEPVQFW